MKAVFAGSFDPITYGHLDIILRASKMFSQLYVAIGCNLTKTYAFPENRRKTFIEEQIPEQYKSRITVVVFTGLLSDFAYENNISVIVRGSRNSSDYNDESSLAAINNSLTGIETIILPTRPELSHISSSAVKAISKEYGDVTGYVSNTVKKAIQQLNGYTLLGIIGGSGTGKSTFSKMLVDNTFDDISLSHINLDKLGHSIYESSEPYAISVREKIIAYFSELDIGRSGVISKEDRKIIGNVVFTDPVALSVLTKLTRPAIMHLMRSIIRNQLLKSTDTHNVFLIDGAFSGNYDVVNNHIIELVCETQTRIERIVNRDGITATEASYRINAQYQRDADITIGHKHIVIDTTNGIPQLNKDTIYSMVMEMIL